MSRTVLVARSQLDASATAGKPLSLPLECRIFVQNMTDAVKQEQLRTLTEAGAVHEIEIVVLGSNDKHTCRILVGGEWKNLVTVHGKVREWRDLDRLALWVGRIRGNAVVRLAFPTEPSD